MYIVLVARENIIVARENIMVEEGYRKIFPCRFNKEKEGKGGGVLFCSEVPLTEYFRYLTGRI